MIKENHQFPPWMMVATLRKSLIADTTSRAIASVSPRHRYFFLTLSFLIPAFFVGEMHYNLSKSSIEG